MKLDSFFLYRVLVPKPIRTRILLQRLRRLIPSHFSSLPIAEVNEEQAQVVDFVLKNGVKIFPYHFTEQYDVDSIVVYLDERCGLKYVMQNDKRLYFKRKWSDDRIRRSFHDLTLEQDEKSPHKYLSPSFTLNEDEVLVDFGAAEGNFSLSMIEKVKRVYLFEADQEWIEALRQTFEPWKDKVEIIPKFVSDSDDEKHCSGDVFFADKEVTFFKIDVDGGERGLLNGMKKTIHEKSGLKIALCTYHQHADEQEFTTLLSDAGYEVTPSNGYMIFYYDKKLQAPYLRRALIRAVKKY